MIGLARHSRLTNGIPSHDTFGRVCCLLDPWAFQGSFADRVAALAESGVGTWRALPIDGPTARRSGRRRRGRASRHRVGARAGAHHVGRGQVAVDNKSNENTAIPRLPEPLDLAGALVTIDAMGCQKEIAVRIVDDCLVADLVVIGGRRATDAEGPGSRAPIPTVAASVNDRQRGPMITP